MTVRVSNHKERRRASNSLQMLERSNASQTKDLPPNYVAAVKMKKNEDEELPIQALSIETELREFSKS
jgi:hypothetical protein